MRRFIGLCFALAASFAVQACAPWNVSPRPPVTTGNFSGIPLNGGRTHAVAVHPNDPRIIVISTQFGGLWRTDNGGDSWRRLYGLQAVFAHDVEWGADGRTLIATLGTDNRITNGGGIWVSRDGGGTWARPATGAVPSDRRTPERGSAYGISRAPDSPQEWYIGTDFGVAHSTDDGATWTHRSVNTGLVVTTDKFQNMVASIVALGSGSAVAMTRTAIYRTDDASVTWRSIRSEDFSFYTFGWNKMDRTSTGGTVFVLRDYSTLYRYDVSSDQWRQITTPPDGRSRWPFVRVSKSAAGRGVRLWIGQGVRAAYVYRSTVVRFSTVTATSWTLVGRGEGVHDDTGDLGVDANGQAVMMGTDGGVFRPTAADALATWTHAGSATGGWNSYQITDLGGTNREGSSAETLYYSTQDNAIWSSNDNGATWPRSDCAEGFHIEVRKRAYPASPITAAYGKIGCGPSDQMLSDEHLANQRAVGNKSTTDADLDKMAEAFWLKQDDGVGNNYFLRVRYPDGSTPEVYVSSNAGQNWRKRFNLAFSTMGPMQRTGASSTPGDYPFRSIGAWLAVATGEVNPDGSSRIGLVRLGRLQLNQIDAVDDSDLIRLPLNGSLGVRATEFDWQAVFGVNPRGGLIIAPDVVAGDVKVSRDGGDTWTVDAALTALVTQSGTLGLYYHPYRMQVTHIGFDPYRPERIFVGTRDAGIICSADGGVTWNAIPDSTRINYITGFHFSPSSGVWVSSYGHGLWRVSSRAAACPRQRVIADPVIRPDRPWTIEREDEIFPPPRGVPAPGRAKVFISTELATSGVPVVGEGGTIRVFGRGFAPNRALTLLIDGARTRDARVVVDAKGEFRITVRVPPDLPRGGHRLTVVGAGDEKPITSVDFVKAHLDEHLGERDQPPKSTPAEEQTDDGEPNAPIDDGKNVRSLK